MNSSNFGQKPGSFSTSPFVKKGKIRFHISLITGILLIVGILSISTVLLIILQTRTNARKTAEQIFQLSSQSSKQKVRSFLNPALDFVSIAASIPGSEGTIKGNGLDHPAFTFFSKILENHDNFYSCYIGREDGTFFQLIRTRGTGAVIKAHDAPENTEWIVRTITKSKEGKIQTFTFLDTKRQFLSDKTDSAFAYDPRKRPWYSDALAYTKPVLSSTYTFNSLNQPGITASAVLPDTRGVVGIDLTLSELVSFIESQKISSTGGMALFSEEKEIIASAQTVRNLTSLERLSDDEFSALFTHNDMQVISDIIYHSEKWKLAENRVIYTVFAAPITDFMSSSFVLQRRIILITLLVVLIVVPFVIFWARILSKALLELVSDAEKVGNWDFSGKVTMETHVYEFYQLSNAFKIMKETIAERTESLKIALEKLQMLVDMTIAISGENEIDQLSEMILSGAKRLTNAEGGTLYLVNDKRDELDFKIILNDALKIKQSGDEIGMSPVPLYNTDGSLNHHNVVSHCFHTGKTANIPDAYESEKFDFSGTKAFDATTGYTSRSFLTVPLKPRGGGRIMGALQLLNAREPETGNIYPFPEEWNSFTEALGSAAAIAVQNSRLLQQEKELFDDLVRFVATAIDAKSPYTAKHCERVADIATMIADEADLINEGPLADFHLGTDVEKREFSIAAWLHDCGKITIPEHIIDKATKLETVYNRIHEIRTRFEVLLRDAQIARHEAVLSGEAIEQADRELEITQKELEDDFAFVARCNDGSEFMNEETQQRLGRIAGRSWKSHFDKFAGISWGEAVLLSEKKKCKDEWEYLLADKEEHIISGNDESIRDGRFLNDPSANLANKGELHNLKIDRGTLTPEERFRVDQHVVQTILMLEALRFPENLSNVPRWAGDHHERLDGEGHPRGRGEAELPVQSRIIALADIFEALIASDRPYKKANTLSEALSILFVEARKNKIDMNLFRLLISSGMYKKVAEKYLQPEQIDEVDVARFLEDAKN